MEAVKVSCVTSTYGRTHCLEEALQSFLAQDYDGEKEMVILNDFPEQTLRFEHPQVRIINLPERIAPLGRKFNRCIAETTGEVVFVWEDDDIYFPWRISKTLERLDVDGLFHCSQAFHEQSPQDLRRSLNLYHGNLAMRRELFEQFPYSESDRCSLDLDLIDRLRQRFGDISQPLDWDEVFYVYRWGSIQSYHGSYWNTPDISARAAEVVATLVQRGQVKTGVIDLVPKWSYDYPKYAPRQG